MNWYSGLLTFVALLNGCAEQEKTWPVTEAAEGGGFQFNMPIDDPGLQQGLLGLGNDSVVTYINILPYRGITYTASWFELPAAYAGIETSVAMDSLFKLVTLNIGGEIVQDRTPLVTQEGHIKQAWMINEDQVRLGCTLRSFGSKVVVMNAAMPEAQFNERAREDMVRFLGSFQEG